jgi:Flp pilus assembly protein TadD
MGDPEPAFSFWHILQVMLRNRYPGITFEVIPAAMVAVNSHVCREIVSECARYNPDIFVVYMGNNEVIGPYGAGTIFSPLTRSSALVRLGIRLKATRFGQLVASALDPQKSVKVWKGLELFLDKPVTADSPALRATYNHFRRNLVSMRDSALAAGSDIIFCTIGTNLRDNPPFGSLHKPDLPADKLKEWNDLYGQGLRQAGDSNTEGALASFHSAASIDKSFAELHFSMAACLEKKGEFDKAWGEYIEARDIDTLRFRADSTINRIIRETACDAGPGSRLVDVESGFRPVSTNGICGSEFFLDHVHMNFRGNYVLARAVCREVEQALSRRAKPAGPQGRDMLSETECGEYMGYGDWEQYEIAYYTLETNLKRPPFTRQADHSSRIAAAAVDIRQMKDKLTPQALGGTQDWHKAAVARNPDDLWIRIKYADFLSRAIDQPRAAVEQYRLVLDKLPHCSDIRVRMAEAIARTGDIQAAEAENRTVLRQSPFNITATYNLGLAFLMQKKVEQAITQFRAALELEPYFKSARNNLGVALVMNGRPDEAVELYREGIRLIPDSEDLHTNLAILLMKKGNRQEALAEVQTVLKINPGSEKARKLLQLLTAGSGFPIGP